jgi:mono/diheme cytochrome c family protein
VKLMRLMVITMAALAPSLIVAAEDDGSVDGAGLYMEHCARCHGQDLAGGNAPSMLDGVWMYGGSGNAARNTTYGIAQQGMPAFGEVLS